MKQKIIHFILCLLLCSASVYAQKKTFVRDYIYQASEDDSRNSVRANATIQMRNILLREIGEYLHAERTFSQSTAQNYSEKIEAITTGIVEMKTLDEQWNGNTYRMYIKTEMIVDSKDLEHWIAEVLNDKQKTKELEESRRRTLAAEAARLRKVLEETKNKQQRLALQKTYTQATDALSTEEYFTKGLNEQENSFNEVAIGYYQKAIAINPNYAYTNMGAAYSDLKNYDEAIQCNKKAAQLGNHMAQMML